MGAYKLPYNSESPRDTVTQECLILLCSVKNVHAPLFDENILKNKNKLFEGTVLEVDCSVYGISFVKGGPEIKLITILKKC